jgi:hypothetical protein
MTVGAPGRERQIDVLEQHTFVRARPTNSDA